MGWPGQLRKLLTLGWQWLLALASLQVTQWANSTHSQFQMDVWLRLSQTSLVLNLPQKPLFWPRGGTPSSGPLIPSLIFLLWKNELSLAISHLHTLQARGIPAVSCCLSCICRAWLLSPRMQAHDIIHVTVVRRMGNVRETAFSSFV